jgi:hypothetical protein
MTLLPLNGWFMLAVAATAIAVIIYWWIITRGSWMQWPAGRSLMGLLAIIAVIAGWAGLNTLILPPRYPLKIVSYLALYGVLEVALMVIGLTIHREMKRGKARLLEKRPNNPTGPVTVTVATENTETPNATS